MPRSRQILIMTFLWAVVLIALDASFNEKLLHPTSAEEVLQKQNPHVLIRINHLCCSGCLSDVMKALSEVPWLGKPEMLDRDKFVSREQANEIDETQESLESGQWSGTLAVDVVDLDQADFLYLIEHLQGYGITIGAMQFSGVEHFSLKANLPHLCCGLCQRAVNESLVPSADDKFGSTLKWLDSARSNRVGKSVLAYARFGAAANVLEFIQTLDEAGFYPATVRLVVDEE